MEDRDPSIQVPRDVRTRDKRDANWILHLGLGVAPEPPPPTLSLTTGKGVNSERLPSDRSECAWSWRKNCVMDARSPVAGRGCDNRLEEENGASLPAAVSHRHRSDGPGHRRPHGSKPRLCRDRVMWKQRGEHPVVWTHSLPCTWSSVFKR